MKNKLVLTLLFAAFLCTCIHAVAQQVAPDSAFGTNGIFKQEIQNEVVGATYALLQPDGKLLIGINTSDGSGYDQSQLIYRITPAGNLDEGFGNNGILQLGMLIKNNSRYSITRGGYFELQADGKIVAATIRLDRSGDLADKIAIERYLPDGKPDSSFGTNGINEFPTYQYEGYPYANLLDLKIKPNGKIMVAAMFTAYDRTTTAMVIAQFNERGYIDRSFGDTGVLKLTSPYEQDIYKLLALPNNHFIISGTYNKTDATTGSCQIIHNADGTIDSTRGMNGVLFNDNTVEGDVDMALQQDNKLLVYTSDLLRNTADPTLSKITGILLRYKSNGTLDESFGSGGRVVAVSSRQFEQYPYFPFPHVVKIQENGRIVVSAGEQLRRFLPDGSPDATFGMQGVLTDSAANSNLIFTTNKKRLYAAGINEVGLDFPELIVTAYSFCNSCTTAFNNRQPNIQLKATNALLNAAVIKLYPNPVQTTLLITGLHTDKLTHLQLTDMRGRVLQQATTQSATYQWNMQTLPAGMYYLRIINNTTITGTYKVVKE